MHTVVLSNWSYSFEIDYMFTYHSVVIFTAIRDVVYKLYEMK